MSLTKYLYNDLLKAKNEERQKAADLYAKLKDIVGPDNEHLLNDWMLSEIRIAAWTECQELMK